MRAREKHSFKFCFKCGIYVRKKHSARQCGEFCSRSLLQKKFQISRRGYPVKFHLRKKFKILSRFGGFCRAQSCLGQFYRAQSRRALFRSARQKSREKIRFKLRGSFAKFKARANSELRRNRSFKFPEILQNRSLRKFGKKFQTKFYIKFYGKFHSWRLK